MELNEEQKRFVRYVEDKRQKEVNVYDRQELIERATLSLFHLYLTGKDNRVRRKVAKYLTTLPREVKRKIDLWHIVDEAEMKEIAKNTPPTDYRMNIKTQMTRHRGDIFDGMTIDEWEDTLDYFDRRCAYCGKDGNMTFDHVKPYSKGGYFIKANIIPACKRCNSSKHNKDVKQWYTQKEFYKEEKLEKIYRFMTEHAQLTLF